MLERRADFTRTCEGCDAVFVEKGPKGEPWFRCGAEGPHYGVVVGIGRYNPYLTAWCPRWDERRSEG